MLFIRHGELDSTIADGSNCFFHWFKMLTKEAQVRGKSKTKQGNSVAWVRERTIPTEGPPLVGEVSANIYG
jgi:hypothetical protein